MKPFPNFSISQIQLMNNWIQRNIIFPKINQERIKREKFQEQEKVKDNIIKQLNKNKPISLYNIVQSNQLLKMTTPLTKQKQAKQVRTTQHRKRSVPYNDSKLNQVHSGAVRLNNCDNILELLDQRKRLFHSYPIKKMIKDIKLERSSLQQFSDQLNQLQEKIVKQKFKSRSYKKSKAKTQQVEEPQSKQTHGFNNNFLNIKKVKTFDFSISHLKQKDQVEEISIINISKLKSARYKPKKKMKQTLKITSIKGWRIQEDQLKQYL